MVSSTAGSSTPPVGVDPQLFQQLLARQRAQPYPPTRTSAEALNATLMAYVQRGPQGRLYVGGRPWCE
jgi:hypothetical protein